MVNKIIFTIFILLSISYLGCATVFTGTSDRIAFETKPSGAKVYIDGLEEGVTPTSVRVKRNLSEIEVQLRLEGYEPETFHLKKTFNFVSVLNLCDPLGWAIDIATGAILKYKPKGYLIDLEAKKSY